MRADLAVYAGLFLFSLLVRLPSFFFSVFDWDESTLILMGQSVLDGKIPYVDAWDIKPPFSFYLYASFIALFGKSIAAIRLGGILCISIASVFLYRTGKAVHSRGAGIIAALFLPVFVSTGYSGLSTMIEHILLVPVSLVLYLLMAGAMDRKRAFAAGLALGVAILIKTNMVFESSAVGLLCLLSGSPGSVPPPSERIRKCLVLAAGISIPILLVLSYYSANSELDIFLKTNITAVLQYTKIADASFLDKVNVFLYNISYNLGINLLVWVTFFLGTAFLLLFNKEKKALLAVPLTIFVAQMLSLFLSGQPLGGHYLMTAMPIMSVVSGFALAPFVAGGPARRRVVSVVTIAVIGAGLLYSLQGEVLKRYREILSRVSQRQPLSDDSCYRIARFLDKSSVRGEYVYLVNSCHIANWLTGSRQPTRYVHPSNLLLREYMLKIADGPEATREKELLRILEKKPRFIIHRKDLWPQGLESFKTILDNELQAHYELVEVIDTGYCIYKRGP